MTTKNGGTSMEGLRRLMKRLEAVMSAAAFAESGEFVTARQILCEHEDVDRRTSARPELRKQTLRINI